MSSKALSLAILPATFAVARLEVGSQIPDWALEGSLLSITRTPDELSVVCETERVPPEVTAERGWRCLAVAGPLDFSEVGILAELTGVLAAEGVSLFALSTYDTDYLLVREGALGAAVEALRGRGHSVI